MSRLNKFKINSTNQVTTIKKDRFTHKSTDNIVNVTLEAPWAKLVVRIELLTSRSRIGENQVTKLQIYSSSSRRNIHEKLPEYYCGSHLSMIKIANEQYAQYVSLGFKETV